jgi:phytoene dehydrogenase-like protein
MSQLVMFRPPNRDASLANVYFVGASTTPGNGVPLVLTGARMCAQRVLAEHQ